MEGNFGFTSTLLEMLKRHNNKAPIIITSSVQATLSGRFGDSEYGRSKLAGEELMFKYGKETGVPVYAYRFENMVWQWIRPRYNSAIGTFCYCIDRGEPITKMILLYLWKWFSLMIFVKKSTMLWRDIHIVAITREWKRCQMKTDFIVIAL